MTTIANFTVESADGISHSLSGYAGKVCLVVNVTNTPGFSEQYAGLETLWQRHRDHGFVVLGFPCHQFTRPNSGNGAENATSRASEHGVTFPIFAEVDVNGAAAHPLWTWLRRARPGRFGDRITWNFTRFLVGRDGDVRARYSPHTPPETLGQAVVDALMAR